MSDISTTTFVNYADESNGTIPRIATTNMKNGRVKTGGQPKCAD
jgi:hypothetical protein